MPEPALARIAALLARYRQRGVLLDANVLVVYVVGSYDRRLVSRLGATKGFSGRDAAFLSSIVASVARLVTTPHVLTEVNGLLNTGIPGQLRWGVLGAFAERIGQAVEVHDPASATSSHLAFRHLGLTDAAILALPDDGPLVISSDGALCSAILSRGREALHYNNRVRPS